MVGDGPMILGGDWNLTVGLRRSTEEMKNTPGEVKLLDRLERELGVIPAWAKIPSRWVQVPLRSRKARRARARTSPASSTASFAAARSALSPG